MSSRGYSQSVRFWSVNARKLLRRKAELEARLANAEVDFLFVQETWLSEEVEDISIAGYYLVGRLDRAMGPKRSFGGIAIFARVALTSVALLEYVDAAERMYCVLHTHIGAILLANWYRPPDDDGSSMNNLLAELRRLRCEFVGTILLGDINVHHRKWLRFSNDNTTIGERLHDICHEAGLKQVVNEPTRGDYLLDLVLTDIPELLTVRVLPEISDHRVVCIDLHVAVPSFQSIPRTVWDMQFAQWDDLRGALRTTNWRSFFDDGASVDDAVANFASYLDRLATRYIPRKTVTTKPKEHPWLDEACFAAVEAKCLATGTDEFLEKERICSEVLTAAYLRHQHELRERLLTLGYSSKEWWRVNRELLNRKTKVSTIPSLKDDLGQWILDPAEKANLLTRKFEAKCVLPPRPAVEHDHDDNDDAFVPLMPEFFLIRTRWVLKIIKKLQDNKASGPDGFPVRFFKECSKELALAIGLLARYLVKHRRWPQIWRQHRVQPLFKKGAVSNPGNYRGVHLTNIVSKIVERCVSQLVTPFFDRIGAFGADQWAFRKKRSCRDLVALQICRWLWALDQGFKVGIYLSDISGAFDKVDRDILLRRLRSIGLSVSLVDFFFDYLAPRFAVVIVQGHESHPFVISNQVFQGTVLGPPLWNVFFEPVDGVILQKTFKVVKFADDLSAYKNFEASTNNVEIKKELVSVQSAVHEWGVQNRVGFDQGKEHFCVLHRGDPDGITFKLLGVLVDPKLNMGDEIGRIKKKASPKISAILASRWYYNERGLVHQYKAHVLCLLEFSSVAIFHAADSHLDELDALQRRFLHALNLSDGDAFLQYNLAPLRLRRDIAVLGFLHRIQLGEVHEDFAKLFPTEVHGHATNSRHNKRRHGRQFREIWGNTDYFNRSVFSAVRVYNVLPEYVVTANSVQAFQSLLTKDAKFCCRVGRAKWERMYSAHYGGFR